MMKIEKKLEELGVKLPEPATPVAAYVPFRRTGNLVYISGQDCKVNGELKYKGKVGKDVTEEEAYEAAKIAAINLLAILKSAVGDLDRVRQIVNLHGYVNSAAGFVRQPFVINGASEFLVEVFGEKGKHSRCALSCNELPFDTPVAIEMIVEVEA
ncbi:MAG: RidA family protein [Firmicutes bacterium]|nr:RidA family protein [Bacillota bacterium]